jgi:aspartate/methionine/tyrosine aminotransferase
MIEEAALRRIVDIAMSVGALLFSDEAFRLLELLPRQTLPAACDLYENAVSAAGLSKPFGLGGLRIGWTATRNAEIARRIKQYRFYTTEMTGTPSQWLASAALQRKSDILPRNRDRIAANLALLAAFVEARGDKLKLLPPHGGTMALVQQFTGIPSLQLCGRALAEARLFLIPGEPLGIADNFLRFGLGMADFAKGLERFGEFFDR